MGRRLRRLLRLLPAPKPSLRGDQEQPCHPRGEGRTDRHRPSALARGGEQSILGCCCWDCGGRRCWGSRTLSLSSGPGSPLPVRGRARQGVRHGLRCEILLQRAREEAKSGTKLPDGFGIARERGAAAGDPAGLWLLGREPGQGGTLCRGRVLRHPGVVWGVTRAGGKGGGLRPPQCGGEAGARGRAGERWDGSGLAWPGGFARVFPGCATGGGGNAATLARQRDLRRPDVSHRGVRLHCW